MQNFDLLDFLSHNYISLKNLVNQNMWRSYCYGDPNIWWWHLQEETEMPFGGTTTYQVSKNNRYRVSMWIAMHEYDNNFITFYLYIEDLKLARVHVYVSTLLAVLPEDNFLKTITNFQNLRIELLDNGDNLIHSHTWNNTMTLLKGRQCTFWGLYKSLLLFDPNEALLYLYDRLWVPTSDEEETPENSSPDQIIHFLAFSSQSTTISGIKYRTLEVTSMGESPRLYQGLNNTHIYISNIRSHIHRVKITQSNLHTTSELMYKSGFITMPFDAGYRWLILFVFRPTPVVGDRDQNYDVAIPIEQNFTGNHSPITRWKLDDGYSLSINCNGVFNNIFILATFILTNSYSYFLILIEPTDDIRSGLFVIPDLNLPLRLSDNSAGFISRSGVFATYEPIFGSAHYLCDIHFTSLFHYYGDNTENLIWLFLYDSENNSGTAHVIYSQNMNEYASSRSGNYTILNWYLLGIYDEMLSYDSNQLTTQSYLSPYNYYNHVTSLFIYNTLAHTAPQVVNSSWGYMHYIRFVLDDYTSSNLRIPLAIVEGDIRRDNIKHREMQIDKMTTSQRYPIAQLSSLSKAQMPDVVLDGYIASLNSDAGKKEDTSFGTLIPYYDLKEAQIQEPHPEWYFRIYIHAGTWYYIFKNIMSNNNNQMKTYRIQHNDGSLRIVLDVGLYFEIITETSNTNNKKYTIVYADIFPSVYWCYGSESYEFLNVNVEWIQCRYSMPGSSMVRAKPNSNTVIIRSRELF
jgi:hypothetical protein